MCICHIMTTVKVDTCIIEAYTKLLLSCSVKFTDDGECKKHHWWMRENILSLLNLTEQIGYYG